MKSTPFLDGARRVVAGANANYLMDVLGAPDEHSNGRMMKWTKTGLNCLLNDRERSDIRNAGGAGAEDHGGAEELDWRGAGMKLIWPQRGVLIWFHNTVYQIVLFKPQT